MSFAFIVNPHSAGGKTKKKWDSSLEPVLKAKNVDYKVFFTERREHAIQLAREALETGGFKNVVSVGGDGTFHEIVNGVLDSDGQMIKAGANVGIICSGTGSDFIKTMGISQDPVQALESLLKENTRTIDALKGTFNDMNGNQITKFCINVADAGIGGDVVDLVNRSRKIFGGKATFMIAELRVIMRFKAKPISLQIDSEETRDLELLQIFFSNCMYNGGGLRAGYKSKPDDGLMDIFYMEGLSTSVVASNFSKLYKDDATIEALMKKYEPHIFYTQCKKARLVPRNEKAILLDFDGEMVGKAPLDIEIIPSSVNVLCS